MRLARPQQRRGRGPAVDLHVGGQQQGGALLRQLQRWLQPSRLGGGQQLRWQALSCQGLAARGQACSLLCTAGQQHAAHLLRCDAREWVGQKWVFLGALIWSGGQRGGQMAA